METLETKGQIISHNEWKSHSKNHKLMEVDIDGYVIDLIDPIIVTYYDRPDGLDYKINILDSVFYNNFIMEDSEGNPHLVNRNELGTKLEKYIQDKLYDLIFEKVDEYMEEYNNEEIYF